MAKYEDIGGFRVKNLPDVPKSRDNEIATCETCGVYGTRGEMCTKGIRYQCAKCKARELSE